MQDTNVVDINRAISNYRNCECFFLLSVFEEYCVFEFGKISGFGSRCRLNCIHN